MKHVTVIGARGYPSAFPGTSGVEVYIEELANATLEQVDTVHFTILTRSRYQNSLRQTSHSRLTVIPLWSLPGKILEPLSYAVVASMHACLHGSDIVWYHTAGMAVFSWLPRLFGKKVWLTVHSADWERKKWSALEKVVFFHTFRMVAKRCVTKVFAVSRALASEVSQLLESEVTTAKPGVPRLTSFIQKKNAQTNEKPYLLYLGRLVPEKRVEWLLRFASEEKRRTIIAGSHGNLPEYEQELRRKYNSQHIEWRGSVHGDDKWQLLSRATLLVLPSELEGFPITVMESLSVRTPCLLYEGVLPDELQSFSCVTSFKKNTYASFRKRLLKLSSELPTYTFTQEDAKNIGEYTWSNTAKTLAFLLRKEEQVTPHHKPHRLKH